MYQFVNNFIFMSNNYCLGGHKTSVLQLDYMYVYTITTRGVPEQSHEWFGDHKQ